MDQADFRITTAASTDAAKLITALDDDIRGRYPDLPVNGIDVADFEAGGGVFVIAYAGDAPVACGAFRPYGNAAEIKRMFVDPAFRGPGLARRLLQFLEEEPVRPGFAPPIFETR